MRHIDGAEKLTSIFGKWPSFHDGEVWSLSYERTADGFDVVAIIHVFAMTSEVDDRGYFKLVNHTRAQLRFVDCADVNLAGFNHQNVLFSLQMTEDERPEAERPLAALLETSYGLEGRLLCRRIQVVEAIPWIPPHGVYARK